MPLPVTPSAWTLAPMYEKQPLLPMQPWAHGTRCRSIGTCVLKSFAAKGSNCSAKPCHTRVFGASLLAPCVRRTVSSRSHHPQQRLCWPNPRRGQPTRCETCPVRHSRARRDAKGSTLSVTTVVAHMAINVVAWWEVLQGLTQLVELV